MLIQDKEVVKVRAEFILSFLMSVVSSGKLQEQLGKRYLSYLLYYNCQKKVGAVIFYH